MKKMFYFSAACKMQLAAVFAATLLSVSAFAQGPGGPGGRQQQPIVLEADEKPAFPAAPVGFDQKRTSIDHGTIDTVTYDSKSVGTKRKMSVYTPPGYNKNDKNTKYPVLYLLHGIGGDHAEWTSEDAAHEVLDNLYAEK